MRWRQATGGDPAVALRAGDRRGGSRRCSCARGFAATIEAAPELLPLEAQIVWEQGYDHLDLAGCIARDPGLHRGAS